MLSAFSRTLPVCGLFAFGAVLTTLSVMRDARPALAQMQQPAETVRVAQVGQPPASSVTIGEYWKRVYGEGGIEAPRAVEAAPVPPPPPSASDPDPFKNFLDHLTFRAGATYVRNFAEFTGKPTTTFVVDNCPTGTVTRQGFCFPQDFTSYDQRLNSYLILGTTGYGDPRLNTYVSMIYRSGLDGLTSGSPFQSILDVFTHGNRAQVLNAYAEWTGFGTGALSHTSLRVGRQYAFDTTPDLLGSPILDGATVSYRDSALDVAVFSGRRVNLFGNQEDDVTAGGSASYRFRPGTSATVNYFFLPGIHRYALNLNHQIGDVHTGSFLTFRNDHPVELGTRAWYASPSSPWTLRGTFLRQLTDQDFTYDMFADREPPTGTNEQLRRLFLGRIRPATQLTFDVDRQINSWLTLGAGVAARFVDGGESAFDNSFEQVVGRMNLTPFDRWNFLWQYRYRHMDRSSTNVAFNKATTFDDVSHAGETVYQEVSTEIGYRLGARLTMRVGGYVGVYDSRERLAEVNGIVVAGGYAQARVRVHRMMDLKFEYGIGRGNPEFNPDLARQHTLRVGFDIFY